MSSTADLAAGPPSGIAQTDTPGSPRQIAEKLRSIVHELNNPLAVVMGFTQLMLLNDRCEGKVRTDLDRIYAEIQRVATGVEKLHSFALSLQAGGAPGDGSGAQDDIARSPESRR